jgi:hypothetical protein
LLRVLVTLALLLAASVTVACAPVPSSPTPDDTETPGPRSASSKATTETLSFELSVSPIETTPDETVTATVTYRNISTDTTLTQTVAAGAVYTIRVTASDGSIVYDSFERAGGAIPRPPDILILAPGDAKSGDVDFTLPAIGSYSVIAFMETGPGLRTPPVIVDVRE